VEEVDKIINFLLKKDGTWRVAVGDSSQAKRIRKFEEGKNYRGEP